MSLTPGITPPSGSQQSLSDVVGQDDLTRWAQIAGVMKYLTAPLDPPPAPSASLPMATGLMASVFTNMYAGLRQAGVAHEVSIVQSSWWSGLLAQLGSLAAALIQLVALLLTPLAQAVLLGLDALRKGIDPSVGILAQSVLAEFLGTEVSTASMPLGLGTGDHLARAQSIGALLYSQLESEFAPAGGGAIAPSTAPAQTFAGLAINFGLASGILGLIGGMVPYGHWEELRELGEEVATNIGLGRLVRRALQPLIQIMVANPLQWALNQKYLPTQFALAELVNPYTASVMPQDQVFKAMNLLGYSTDKIQTFIQLHQKRLNVTEVKLLLDNGFWSESTAETYVQNLGYPQELVPTIMLVEELKEERTWNDKLVSELETEVKAGKLGIDEFTQVVNALPYSQPTKAIIIATVNYKLKAHVSKPPHALSEGELVQGFEAGLLTASDLTDRWTALRVSPADQNVRMLLLLLRLSRLETISKDKQEKYQEQLVAFQQKVQGQKASPVPPIEPVPPFPLNS